MTEIVVTDWNDLADTTLTSAGKDRVLAALKNAHDAVLYTEPWVIADSELEPFGGSHRLVPIDEVVKDSGDGLLVRQGEVEQWVGKSVADVYRVSESGIEQGKSPQAFLGDYADE